MKKFDLKILACPHSNDELVLKEKENLMYLYSPKTNRKYPVIDGIGIFLNPKELSKQSIKFLKLFEVLSPIYDFIIKVIIVFKRKANSEDVIRKEIRERIGIEEGTKKILEVAIGTGTNIIYLNKNMKYFGIDYSLKMLKKCKKKMEKSEILAELFCSTAEKMPFKDNSFDITFCVNGFMYFDNIKKSINEIIRVTKNGGKVIIINKTSWEEAKNIRKYLPENIQNVEMDDFFDNMLNMIRFRKLEK